MTNGPTAEAAPAQGKGAKGSWAEQAATAAIWGPIIAVILGLVANGGLKPSENGSDAAWIRSAWLVVGGVNLVLIITSFCLGLLTIGMAVFHKVRGVLTRGVIGTLMSGVLLGAAASLLMAHPAERFNQKLVGEWESRSGGAGGSVRLHLSLREDHTGKVEIETPGGMLTANGQWGAVVRPNGARPQLGMKFDAGTDSRLGPGTVWEVERVSEKELVLVGKTAQGVEREEVYQRQ